MSMASQARSKSHQARILAFLAYVVAIFALLGVAMGALVDLRTRSAAVSANRDLLARFEARGLPTPATTSPADNALPGSPFLEGQTMEQAGATLQQRVDAAVTTVGGSVLSSQVELAGPLAKDGFVGLSANFNIDQPELQKLLYDLEAGMPFLFVDSLSVQMPEESSGINTHQMRVAIGVSGQWKGKQ